jgi:hypothetical protein
MGGVKKVAQIIIKKSCTRRKNARKALTRLAKLAISAQELPLKRAKSANFAMASVILIIH